MGLGSLSVKSRPITSTKDKEEHGVYGDEGYYITGVFISLIRKCLFYVTLTEERTF